MGKEPLLCLGKLRQEEKQPLREKDEVSTPGTAQAKAGYAGLRALLEGFKIWLEVGQA